MANGNFGGGDGSALTPFLVEDAMDLIAITEGLSYHYIQTEDIDLSGYDNFPYIGKGTTVSFHGSYDGKGRTISNLRINEPTLNGVGLFSSVGGRVCNLNIINANVRGANSTGIVCGSLTANNSDCFLDLRVDGHLHGVENVGFIVGRGITGSTFPTSIKRCVITGTITGSDRVGGILGYANNMVFGCFCLLDSINRIGTSTRFSTIKGDGSGAITDRYQNAYLETMSFIQL